MAEEVVIYEKEGIKITNLRAVFGNKTYAMSNITSVTKGRQDASGCLPGGLAILGLLLVVTGFSSKDNFLLVIVGLIIAGLGIATFLSRKPQHIVQIGSASGEINALTSRDEKHIVEIVKAINDAIIKKG